MTKRLLGNNGKSDFIRFESGKLKCNKSATGTLNVIMVMRRQCPLPPPAAFPSFPSF